MIEFIIPDPDGQPTGGTLFNRNLVTRLRRDGVALRIANDRANDDAATSVWVDTLFLERFDAIAGATPSATPVGLLTHYLPTLVRCGERPNPAELSSVESFALTRADRFVVPSGYLAQELESFGVSPRKIRVVEPGVNVPPARDLPQSPRRVRGVIVANVTPAKGILPFLQTLARCSETALSTVVLTIVGSIDARDPYGAACLELVETVVALREVVRFSGPLAPAACARTIGDADIFLSASQMESFGMALAEARAMGVPIIARRGGNSFAHVEPAWGGQRCADETAVARAFVDLAAEEHELAARCNRAMAHRCRRDWDQVAHEFAKPWAPRK